MSALSAEYKVPASQGSTAGLFLLGGALAALWLSINLAFPGLAPTGIPTTLTRLAIHIAFLAGLWFGLSRTDFSNSKRVLVWLAVAIPFTLWLAVVWKLALSGVFQVLPGNLRPPTLPIAIFAPVIVGLFVLLRSKEIGTILDATPASWLVALQVYRIFGGIFIVNWIHGIAPGVFAWPAGVGDMLTGIVALPTAYWLASGADGGRGAAIAWNIFGLLDFAVAVTMGTLSSPGPFQIFGFDLPPALGTFPTVMIPAFAVPSSILLHALSIRQLRRIASRPAADS